MEHIEKCIAVTSKKVSVQKIGDSSVLFFNFLLKMEKNLHVNATYASACAKLNKPCKRYIFNPI